MSPRHHELADAASGLVDAIPWREWSMTGFRVLGVPSCDYVDPTKYAASLTRIQAKGTHKCCLSSFLA